MEHVIGALFAFFEETPAAFGLLFREVWASREPEIGDTTLASRAVLTSDIAAVLADTDMVGDELTAASVGILGFALANIEASLGRPGDRETAWRVTCRYATALFDR